MVPISQVIIFFTKNADHSGILLIDAIRLHLGETVLMSTDMEINKHKHIVLDTIPIAGATVRDPSMGTQAYPSHLNLPQRARSILARTEHSLEEGKLIPLRTTSSSRGWLDKHLAFHRLREPITCLSEVL